MRIRLTRKFANLINGIDLSDCLPGDDLDVSKRDGDILVAEGWAQVADDSATPTPKRKQKVKPQKPRKRRR